MHSESSSWKPVLQVQWKLPSVLVQLACGLHPPWLISHSLKSAQFAQLINASFASTNYINAESGFAFTHRGGLPPDLNYNASSCRIL